MSSHKSQNLNLHLWEPDDSFLRTEFNENFAAIDAAEHGTAETAAQITAMADSLSRDLYQQTVRNRIYHGLGGTSASLWVNALGSLDEVGYGRGWNGVNGVHLGDGNAPTVEGIEASAVLEGVINHDDDPKKPSWASVRFRSDGYGVMKTVAVLLYKYVSGESYEYDYTIQLTRIDTGTVIGRAGPFHSESFVKAYNRVDLEVNFPLEANTEYRMEFSLPDTYSGPVKAAFALKNPFVNGSMTLMTLTDRAVPTTLSASVTPPDWAKSAVGLVRWQGSGSVALKVNGAALPVTAARNVTSGTGLVCRETELKLAAVPSGTLSVVLQMTKGSGNLNVYDYGLLWR